MRSVLYDVRTAFGQAYQAAGPARRRTAGMKSMNVRFRSLRPAALTKREGHVLRRSIAYFLPVNKNEFTSSSLFTDVRHCRCRPEVLSSPTAMPTTRSHDKEPRSCDSEQLFSLFHIRLKPIMMAERAKPARGMTFAKIQKRYFPSCF